MQWNKTEPTEDSMDAFDIINVLGDGLDFVEGTSEIRWKCYLKQDAFDAIKNDPDDPLYTGEDGHLWVRVFDNDSIPFVIHMRFAGIDNSLPAMGCRREVEEG